MALRRDSQVRVLLAADDPLVRGGLVALVAREPSLQVIAQVSPEHAAAAILEHDPEVVLWDAGADPRSVLGRLSSGETPSIVLLADERFVADALAAGARGILSRDVPAGRLGAAVAAVLQGLFVLDELWDPAAGGAIRGATSPELEALTAREGEVLQLIAQGLSNKLIGARLGISEHTAKFHVNAILQKLSAQSRTDAVVKAARLGLLVL